MSLQNKKLFLFDIDGTLALGDTLYDGSRELLSHIASIGGKSYFITNNSTKSGIDYVKKFRDSFHLETTEDLFITSGFMTIRFLKENFADKKIYCLGTRSFVAELQKNGLCVTENIEPDIACALVGFDNELTYRKLEIICEILSTTDIPFYATNPDLCCPVPFGFVPDCGSICGMIENSTGKSPIYLGKPNALVVDLCLKASGFSKEETLVIGDRLYTDIACGINAGVDTCVLFTGEAKKADLETTQYLPAYQFDTVSDLLRAL
ncbi:MAG: HAD-IIA family hydrolase [Lachnospiraceae bacterium]|nr:HAD-IIA family hydrolase [Lachnospiraceae bacterium]